jgi:hypothetical protein
MVLAGIERKMWNLTGNDRDYAAGAAFMAAPFEVAA